MAHLEQACQRHGRDRSEVDVGLQLNACIAETDEAAREKFKRSQLFAHVESLSEATLQDQSMEELIQENLIGSPESIIEKVQNYIDQGLSHFPAIIFAANDVDDLNHQMTMFADEIMPSFNQ
jgi:alkanesulfonate monooxygenase SsuD/methylene tetrahydromethanopterin reductase-like flavin-dependent oxidoreductase (luciferase family)